MSDSSSSSFCRASFLALLLSSFLVNLGSNDEGGLVKEERETSIAACPATDSHVTSSMPS